MSQDGKNKATSSRKENSASPAKSSISAKDIEVKMVSLVLFSIFWGANIFKNSINSRSFLNDNNWKDNKMNNLF